MTGLGKKDELGEALANLVTAVRRAHHTVVAEAEKAIADWKAAPRPSGPSSDEWALHDPKFHRNGCGKPWKFHRETITMGGLRRVECPIMQAELTAIFDLSKQEGS